MCQLKVIGSSVWIRYFGDLILKMVEYHGSKTKKLNLNTLTQVVTYISMIINTVKYQVDNKRRMKIPIVRDEYLGECIKKQKKLPFDRYKVEAEGERSGMVTVKVKGRSAVHEASGLQDTCHILEDGKSIYNTTLNILGATSHVITIFQ